MTGPSNKKQVLTTEHLEVLDEHIAYAKAQGDRASGAADQIGQFVGEAGIVLADIEQGQIELAAQMAALDRLPWVVTASVPAYVEVMAILPNALRPGTAALPFTGIVIPTVEVTV
ncbi:hypothetical protein [Deinococcus marmoris]|uniref:hypothetical protein n=1 Tax=Deinococcus marmoris TaxID=249408 RepID=UPI00049533F2|nr:hypothetical protein [Deinococcus marmoris]